MIFLITALLLGSLAGGDTAELNSGNDTEIKESLDSNLSREVDIPGHDIEITQWPIVGEIPYDPGFDEMYGNITEYGLHRPECFFEDLTGACCMNVGMYGAVFKSCIEIGLQLSNMKAEAILHVNDHEILSKEIRVGAICGRLPPPAPPVKTCLNIYHGYASWSNKVIEACAVLEFNNIIHVRFDCFRFEHGHFRHHSDNPPERFGLVNIRWQNGWPRFTISSQPVNQSVRDYIMKQWTRIKNIFRKKSVKFIKWLRKRL